MTHERFAPLQRALAVVVRRRRLANNMSQEELAHRAGRSMRYISLLENCRIQPTLDTLIRISTALGVPLSQVILEAEKEVGN
ncbi:helix-turn-helix transcriptional regulator [Leisingera sp. M527]|nr:helix-turn-helix transcriptional regulator [Leisingera sp. M527]